MVDYNFKGRESEWNEATFKSKRLHDIQELINFFKMNPLGFIENRFNYELWLKNVEALYGEGQSKYSEKEKKECLKIKELLNKMLKFMPPHIPTYTQTIDGQKQSHLFNENNYNNFIDHLYEFEMKVKDLNDAHGLTTKNKQYSGLF